MMFLLFLLLISTTTAVSQTCEQMLVTNQQKMTALNSQLVTNKATIKDLQSQLTSAHTMHAKKKGCPEWKALKKAGMLIWLKRPTAAVCAAECMSRSWCVEFYYSASKTTCMLAGKGCGDGYNSHYSRYIITGRNHSRVAATAATDGTYNGPAESCGNSSAYTDVLKGIRCANCTVLVDSSLYSDCTSYCAKQGMDCIGAFEEKDDSCVVDHSRFYTCNTTIRSVSSDMLCQCSKPKPVAPPKEKWCSTTREGNKQEVTFVGTCGDGTEIKAGFRKVVLGACNFGTGGVCTIATSLKEGLPSGCTGTTAVMEGTTDLTESVCTNPSGANGIWTAGTGTAGTGTVDQNCTGSWTPCTSACESAGQRSYSVTQAQSGNGKACPTATTGCAPGMGACPENEFTSGDGYCRGGPNADLKLNSVSSHPTLRLNNPACKAECESLSTCVGYSHNPTSKTFISTCYLYGSMTAGHNNNWSYINQPTKTITGSTGMKTDVTCTVLPTTDAPGTSAPVTSAPVECKKERWTPEKGSGCVSYFDGCNECMTMSGGDACGENVCQCYKQGECRDGSGSVSG